MEMTCKIDGCQRPIKVKFRRLCNLHYRRFQRHGDPRGGQDKYRARTFLEQVVLRRGERDCINPPWDISGRGSISWDGKAITYARYVCIAVYGEPEDAKFEAAHNCGNGHLGCVNPDHIYWASHRQNHLDRVTHGTQTQGERHGPSKLKDAEVRSIKIAIAEGVRRKDIATRFGVSRQTVNDIAWGRRWAWLDVELEDSRL